MGYMEDRTHRAFAPEDIQHIANTYHEWRNKDGNYEDMEGFARSASIEEIQKNNYVLTPGQYVGVAAEEDDDEPFNEKMERLTKTLGEQMREEEQMNEEIKKQLKKVGFKIE